MPAPSNQTAVTPNRVSHIRFDVSDPAAVEDPYAMQRAGNQIARDRSKNSDVSMLPTGAWRISSYQEKQSYLHEAANNSSAVMQATDFQLASGIVNDPRFRPPNDLLGVTIGPGVAPGQSDNYLRRDVGASQTWHPLTLAPDLAAFPRPPLETTNVSMSRLAVSVVNLKPDEATAFDFETTGTRVDAPDNLFIYYFGGPAATDGSGTYAVVFAGDGRAALWERINSTWKVRDKWRWVGVSNVMHNRHHVQIIPHRTMSGHGSIAFIHQVTDSAPVGGGNITGSFHYQPVSPDSHIYKFLFAKGVVRTSVTGTGKVRVDARDDHRMPFRVSRFRYPLTGVLSDGHFAVPGPMTERAPFTLSWNAEVPSGCTLTGALYDASTDLELTLQGSTSTSKTYKAIRNKNQYYAAFTFTGDGTKTPDLFAYAVVRNGYVLTPSGVSEFTGGLWPSINISYGEGDPSHETMALTINDPANALATLRVRASIPIQYEVEYDPADSTKRSILFRGYAERNEAELIGNTGKQGVGAGGTAKTYPAADFYRYDCSCNGVWIRLQEAVLYNPLLIGQDPAAPPDANGIVPPYKVTDIVRLMLDIAGFVGRIDVPDHPLRFWPVPGNTDGAIIQALTNIGEWVVKTLKDYLGWFLVWDGNAGATGMWRAIPPTVAPYRPMAKFSLDSLTAGKLIHRPESYGSANWVGTDVSVVTAPMLRYEGRRFRSWVKRPEGNVVIAVGTGAEIANGNGQYLLENWTINTKSFDGFTKPDGTTYHSADPTNPDYLGRRVDIIDVDPSLQSQEAVDWAARRIYDVSCHAIKMCSFYAPLVLVTDTADTKQTRPRPLRFYDAVKTIKGGVETTWLVRNVNPVITKDSVQMAMYELQAPFSV